jgi:hypothetical protein
VRVAILTRPNIDGISPVHKMSSYLVACYLSQRSTEEVAWFLPFVVLGFTLCLRWSFSAFVLGSSHKAELVNYPAW